MAGRGRNNNDRVVYSPKAEIKNTPGVYKSGREKREGQRFNKRRRRKQQLKLGAALIGIIVLALVIFINVRHNAFDISIDGEVIASVKKSGVSEEEILGTVKAQIADMAGSDIEINEEVVFEPVHKSGGDLIPVEDALILIKNSVTYKVKAAVLTVDGAEIAALANKEEADGLLNGIIEEYVPEGSNIVEKGFVEKVETVERFVDSSTIISADEARAKLTEGRKEAAEYTVVSGDSLRKIADKNGITLEELLNANPGITVDTVITPGDKLSLEVTVPFISVRTAENVVFTEKQEKEVEYRQDNTKPVSYKKVIQQGVDGQKEVTTQIIRINGFETEQKPVSEKTTVEPVPEIILVGTK